MAITPNGDQHYGDQAKHARADPGQRVIAKQRLFDAPVTRVFKHLTQGLVGLRQAHGFDAFDRVTEMTIGVVA